MRSLFQFLMVVLSVPAFAGARGRPMDRLFEQERESSYALEKGKPEATIPYLQEVVKEKLSASPEFQNNQALVLLLANGLQGKNTREITEDIINALNNGLAVRGNRTATREIALDLAGAEPKDLEKYLSKLKDRGLTDSGVFNFKSEERANEFFDYKSTGSLPIANVEELRKGMKIVARTWSPAGGMVIVAGTVVWKSYFVQISTPTGAYDFGTGNVDKIQLFVEKFTDDADQIYRYGDKEKQGTVTFIDGPAYSNRMIDSGVVLARSAWTNAKAELKGKRVVIHCGYLSAYGGLAVIGTVSKIDRGYVHLRVHGRIMQIRITEIAQSSVLAEY